jgi:hypothetical protein
VRAIPETTTASFAVDLLVMVAVYVYLEALSVSMKRKRLGRLVPMLTHAYAPGEAVHLHPAGQTAFPIDGQ